MDWIRKVKPVTPSRLRANLLKNIFCMNVRVDRRVFK